MKPVTVFIFKNKFYAFDSQACYDSRGYIRLPDGTLLKVAWWDRDDADLFTIHNTPPYPRRIFVMNMPISEDDKVFPAVEADYQTHPLGERC